MRTPKYPARLQESVKALQLLSVYRFGISIEDLAGALGLTQHQMIGNLASYHLGRDVVAGRQSNLVLFYDDRPADVLNDEQRAAWEDDHETDDLEAAVWVRLYKSTREREDPFAVVLDVTQVAELITLADSLYQIDPDNPPLRAAIAELRSRWFPDEISTRGPLADSAILPILKTAERHLRKVEITYADPWNPRVGLHEIEPLQLRRMPGGYEVVAGPEQDGALSTYLVDNILEANLLPGHFCLPPDLDGLIAAHRKTSTVTAYIPNSAPSGYELLADNMEIAGHDQDIDGEKYVTLFLREPVAQRLGLMLLQAGPAATIDEPESLVHTGEDLARRLLHHHGLD